MVDSVHSGYKEAAQVVTWPIDGPESLATLVWSGLSDSIDNSSLKYLFADFELQIMFPTIAAASGETVALYLIPLFDDSTDPNWTKNSAVAEEENEQYFIGSFTVTEVITNQRHVLRNVAMPPGVFKLGMRNNSVGTSTTATLSFRRWNFASQ